MALGKNIKRKTLIPVPEEPKGDLEKKTIKKAASASKKKAPATKKVAATKQPSKPKPRRKVQESQPAPEVVKTVLQVEAKPSKSSEPKNVKESVQYVSQHEYDRRMRLRENFNEQLAEMRGRKVHLIVFSLHGRQFALEIDKTSEVVKTSAISPLPHVPEYIQGVTNIRGSVVIALDLAAKFGISNDTSVDNPYTVVIESNDYKIGLLVPEVPETLIINGDDISSAAGMIADTARDETYIKGIIKLQEKMIFFLDIEELVEGNKVAVLPEGIQA